MPALAKGEQSYPREAEAEGSADYDDHDHVRLQAFLTFLGHLLVFAARVAA